MIGLRRAGAAAVLACLAFGAPALAAQNWADTTDLGAGDPAFDASKAICGAHAATPIPPPPAGPPAPAGCSSETFYYGIGMPADPAAARRCALREQQADPGNDAAFAGSAMLMTMFANGQGAPRDLDVALALACTLAGAPAEMDGRIKHLLALKTDGAAAVPFSFCDDVTSGAYQGACAEHDSTIAAGEREAAFAAFAAPWSPADKSAFTAVRVAMEAFARSRGRTEIDLSGTARAVFAVEAEDAVRDDLLQVVRGLGGAGRKHAPSLSLAGEDKALNIAYKAVMAVADPSWGTPTKAGIQATQRLWIVYRDALAAFVTGLAGAPAAADAAAILTHRRTAQLREFLN